MSAFVVFVGTEEKHGVLNPDIVGPFADSNTASTWLSEQSDRVDLWMANEGDCWGGYPAIYIVSDDTSITPNKWVENWSEVFGEEEIEDEAEALV